MIKIKLDEESEKEYEYLYAEGGIEKSGKPSFHIDASRKNSKGYRESKEIYFTFDTMEEFDEFISDLKEQVKK